MTRIKNDEKFMERESTSARRISAPDPRHMTAFIICGHMAGVAASFAGDLVRPLGRTRASNRVIWDQREVSSSCGEGDRRKTLAPP